MKLFLFLLLPISIIIFYFNKEKDERAHFLPVIFIGIFTAAIYLAYKLLFSTFYFVPSASFFKNLFYFFFRQALLPAGLFYGLFVFIAKKDTWEDRFSYFFPAVAAFYSVYLPYIVLETAKPYSGFILFIKPILFLVMIALAHRWINSNPIDLKDKKKSIINSLILLLILAIPGITESAWITGLNPVCWILPFIGFTGYFVYTILPKDM